MMVLQTKVVPVKMIRSSQLRDIKVEPGRFADGLDVRFEAKRSPGQLQGLGPVDQKDEDVVNEMGKSCSKTEPSVKITHNQWR